MSREIIITLLDKAIKAGGFCSTELHDIYIDLDENLGTDGKEGTLRYFFDCWSDAINHDFMVYDTKDPQEWTDAAIELKQWYINEASELSHRSVFNEALPKNV